MADPSDELARAATVTTAGGAAASSLGEKLGRYRLERRLGTGGMGVVHAAFDPDLERRVALKVLRISEGGEEARRASEALVYLHRIRKDWPAAKQAATDAKGMFMPGPEFIVVTRFEVPAESMLL